MTYSSDRRKEEAAEQPKKLPRVPWISDKLFYGWIIVFVGFVTQFFQGVSTQGYGTYLPHLGEQFGWSAAVMAMPRSVAQINNSILGPIEGFLVDRFGPRRVVAIGVFIMGGGLILFGLTNSLWLFFVSNIVIAIGTGLQGLLIMSVAVNNWFRRRRSTAQSFMLLGYAMAGVAGVPLLVMVQMNNGWQISAIGSGLIIWAVGFPCTFLLRTKPEAYGLLPDGDVTPVKTVESSVVETAQKEEYSFTVRQAIRTRTFWLLGFGWAIGNLGLGAIQVHLFLYLDKELGIVGTVAATIWQVASISNIPSRLIGGFFGDRLPKHLVLVFSMIMMAISTYLLAIATSLPMAMAYAVVYGIGWGIRTPVMNALQADYFGRLSMGKIMGWLQSISIPLTIAAPPLVGYFYDIQGTYRHAFIALAIIMVFGAVLIFLAKPPKPPVSEDTGQNVTIG